MGIALLFISVLLFAYSMIFVQSGLTKRLWVTGSVILLAIIAVTLILNDTEHFGMRQVTEEQEFDLLSNDKNSPTKNKKLIYKKLGSGQEKIYFFLIKRSGPAKLEKTDPMTTKAFVKRDPANKLTVAKNYWVYTNGWSKFYFAGGQPNHQFIDQRFTFHIDQSWQLSEYKK